MFGGLRKVAAGEANIDFVGKIRVWLTISGIVVGLSLIGILFVRLNFGLSFKGGTSLRAPLESGATIPQIRDALQAAGVENAEVQIATSRATGDREVLVQSKRIPPGNALTEAQDALAEAAGLSSRAEVNVEDVGPKWGRQVTNKSVQGLIVFIILVAAYISFRFELKMAVCALGALFHDLISTAGIYALIGFEVSPATVVALLTILGYSLYDTVVVFDKIKENSQALTSGQMRGTYSDMVNRSVNETFMRSINTSLTSLIPVAALLAAGKLLIGGAQQLTDLALAMLVGIFVSSYSSIFFASPLLAKWKERESRYRALRSRALKQGPLPPRGPVFATATAGPAGVDLDGDEEPAHTPPPRTMRPGVARQAVARPRKRKRGKRRRR